MFFYSGVGRPPDFLYRASLNSATAESSEEFTELFECGGWSSSMEDDLLCPCKSS